MKKPLELFVCAAAFCASVYSLAMYCLCHGPMSFTFFTTISNIFVPIVMVWRMAAILSNKAAAPSKAYKASKFVAAVSITVTFLVYLLILAPTNGHGFFAAYKTSYCASLCAHVISPLFTIVHFFAFDSATVEKNLLAPCSLAYPAFYCIPAFGLAPIFGLAWSGGKLRVPYNFLNYEAPCGWFGFDFSRVDSTTIGVGVAYVLFVLGLVFLGVGSLLWKMKAATK